MVMASDWVGFTFPGIIDEPGSFSGRDNSARPQRGPEPIQRISLAIFMSEHAKVFSAPETITKASWAASAANLFEAAVKRRPVSCAIRDAHRSANSGWVLSPDRKSVV